MQWANPFAVALAVVLSILGYVFPIAVLYGVYWLVSMPLRRRERARLFLDLVETGLEDGHTPERVIVDVARSKDTMLGARFHLLAAHIEDGLRLPEALAKVRRLLPPEITAMLKVGAELGDIRRVLPACRHALNDAVSQTRGAINYLAITVFVLLPAVPVLTLMMSVFVVPRFEMIARDMTENNIPTTMRLVFGLQWPVILLQLAVMLALQFLVVCYVAGPRLRQALRRVPLLGGVVDRLTWMMPWRRKRMQRDFAAMLALLLDAGVPEAKAVRTAGEATNSSLFILRAYLAAERLARGVPLPQALQCVDRHRELAWRVANAAHGSSGFVAALRGWFEALDAKAFQQEQTAAQTLTTGVVLWNGLMIGAFVVAVFHFLAELINGLALW
jgi:type II secretory pathway component PulF